MHVPVDIVERDDGRFQIGIIDGAPGPFETREHAGAVAMSEERKALKRRQLDVERA